MRYSTRRFQATPTLAATKRGPCSKTTHVVPPAELGAGKIYIDTVATRGPATVLDLSYMMILVLRDLYYHKYSHKV